MPEIHHHFLNVMKTTTVEEHIAHFERKREDSGHSLGKSCGVEIVTRKLPGCQGRHPPLCLPYVGTAPSIMAVPFLVDQGGLGGFRTQALEEFSVALFSLTVDK